MKLKAKTTPYSSTVGGGHDGEGIGEEASELNTEPERKMPTGNRMRRAKKFVIQRGICHWCKRQMTLDRGAGRPAKNFATFEHLHRKRDGGLGKPNNVVLACHACNHDREKGIQTSKPKYDNIAARAAKKHELLARLEDGTINDAERGELFSRGILPNWPMWSKMMARIPLGNP